MEGAKNLIFAFMLIAFFIVAFISFGVNMGEEHNADININNNTIINSLYSSANQSIYTNNEGETIQQEANDTLSGFNEEDVSGTESDGIFFSVVTSIGKTIMGGANRIFNAIWDPLLKLVIPGSEGREIRQVVSVVLSAMLTLLLVLLAWKLYRVGH